MEERCVWGVCGLVGRYQEGLGEGHAGQLVEDDGEQLAEGSQEGRGVQTPSQKVLHRGQDVQLHILKTHTHVHAHAHTTNNPKIYYYYITIILNISAYKIANMLKMFY